MAEQMSNVTIELFGKTVEIQQQATLNQCAGIILKAYRIKANIGQEDIGKLFGTSSQAISKIELGLTTLNLTKIDTFAKGLNVDPIKLTQHIFTLYERVNN